MSHHDTKPMNSIWFSYMAADVVSLCFLACFRLASIAFPLFQESSWLIIQNGTTVPVCNVYISNSTSSSWGRNWLGQGEELSPLDQRVFEVPDGTYDILLTDCRNNKLYESYGVVISGPFTINVDLDNIIDCNELLEEGEEFYLLSNFERSLSYFNSALQCYRDVGNRNGEGIALGNMGAAYDSLGLYEQALIFYEQALVASREAGDLSNEGITLNNIGEVYRVQGRYVVAQDYYDRARAIAVQLGNRSSEATSLNNIGLVKYSLGNLGEAITYFEESLGISRIVGNRLGEGAALHNLGLVYHANGQYALAQDSYDLALAIAREVGDRVGEEKTLNAISGVYRSLGQYDRAMIYVEQALNLSRIVSDRAGEAAALNNLGDIYRKQGYLDQALAHFEQALSIHREVGNRPAQGAPLLNIGLVYHSLQRSSDALNAFFEALAISREVGDLVGEGAILNNIALVYLSQGAFEQALSNYMQALVVAEQVGDRLGETMALYNIGRVHQAVGDDDQALNFYNDAVTVLESTRASIGTETGRIDFIGQYEYLFGDTMNLNLMTRRTRDAFYMSERARARTFLDSLATGYVELDNKEMDRLIQNERSAYQSRWILQEMLARGRAQDPLDKEWVARLEDDLAEAEAAHEATVSAITSRSDRLSALIPGRGLDYVLDVEETQAQLSVGTTLVSYFLYTTHNEEEQAVAFVLTQDSFEAVSLAVGEQQLGNEIEDFRRFASTGELHPDSLKQLYTWLIEPLAKHLTTPNLIIVPHGVLHYLPFAALTDGVRYLGDQFVISTLPSASTLPLLAESHVQTSKPLVLGNPISATANLTSLPAAEVEATKIAALYDDTAFTGLTATESLVHEQAGRHGVLHIAAHAGFNSVAPLQSGLYLAADGTNDGILHVDEVYGLNLEATDLVVLSACQTNIGEVSVGDDFVALNRAFLFAGAPAVVASLWNVNDEATSILMTSFYTYLNLGWSLAEALHQVQIDLRTEHPEYAHPYYWAAFVLNGEGGTVIQAIQAVEPAEGEETTTSMLQEAEVLEETEEVDGYGTGLCLGAAMPLALAIVTLGRRRQRRDVR